MIAARIACDHFLLWRLPLAQAAVLVPGLQPLQHGGEGWLLCAAAEFTAWRVRGWWGPGRLRTAAWLVPCRDTRGRIGNAFVARFVDHALLPHGLPLAGWRTAGIRLDADSLRLDGQAEGRALTGNVALDLGWFAHDRCGLLRQASPSRGWLHWPIAKNDWSWRARPAQLRSRVADAWGAQPCAMITVAPTLARWGRPTSC